jgi:hypothetical protein
MTRFSVLMMVTLAAACSSDAEWGGTMTDSAGIVLVQNPERADWTLVDQPLVEEELSIGAIDGPPEYQFGQIAAVDVADDGRIYVLDQQAAQVRVFDASGRFVQSIGKPGNGPGELSAATVAVLVGEGDSLYVADMMQQRITRFAPDGTDAGVVAVPIAQGIPVAWAVSPQRRFVTQVRPMTMPGMPQTAPAEAQNRDWILLRDTHGEVVDTLLGVESGRTVSFSSSGMSMRLFESEPLWALLSDGRIVHGRNDVYRLEVLKSDRSVERVITRPFQRASVTEADRAAFLTFMRQSMESTGQVPPQVVDQFLSQVQFADNYPAYARILGGPHNTIWVQHVRTAQDVQAEGGTFDVQDVGAARWDVFDDEGRLLGVIEMPPRFQPLRVIGSHIYGVKRDDLDVQHVVRLRLRSASGDDFTLDR